MLQTEQYWHCVTPFPPELPESRLGLPALDSNNCRTCAKSIHSEWDQFGDEYSYILSSHMGVSFYSGYLHFDSEWRCTQYNPWSWEDHLAYWPGGFYLALVEPYLKLSTLLTGLTQ